MTEEDSPMETLKDLAYGAWIFRLLGALLGVGVVLLGLHLFGQRHRDAGAMSASYGGANVNVKGVAGLFFVALGSVIALVALLKPMEFKGKTTIIKPDGETIEEEFYGAPAMAPDESIHGMPDSLRFRDSVPVD
jgi:hypothetical protein